MKLIIDNSQRIFVITTSLGSTYVCNLSQISSVIVTGGFNEGYYKISELWNGKLKNVSRKYLKELYKANYIDQFNLIVSIDIQTRGYWDKTYGNSYIAGWVTVNNNLPSGKTFVITFQYGSKDMALQFAEKVLSENGILTTFKNSSDRSDYLRRNGIKVNCSHADGYKQSELKAIK